MASRAAKHFPQSPGAYAVMMNLARPRQLPIARLKHPRIEPGRYIYGGSARGPGGLRARLGRHLGLKKKKHWHVDHLRAVSRVMGAAAFLDQSECALIGRLLEMPGVFAPLAGLLGTPPFTSIFCQPRLGYLV